MRGMTDMEHQELAALVADERERMFHGPTLDALEDAGRIERFDDFDDSYRLRATQTGTLALQLWPLIRRT